MSCIDTQNRVGPVVAGSSGPSVIMEEQVDRLVKKTWGMWDEMNTPNQHSSVPLRAGIESMPAQI